MNDTKIKENKKIWIEIYFVAGSWWENSGWLMIESKVMNKTWHIFMFLLYTDNFQWRQRKKVKE